MSENIHKTVRLPRTRVTAALAADLQEACQRFGVSQCEYFRLALGRSLTADLAPLRQTENGNGQPEPA